MTKTTRNALIALAVMIFGEGALQDSRRHDTSAALDDLVLGAIVCYVVLRISKVPAKKPVPDDA